MEEIKSPLTHGACELVNMIQVSHIAKLYREAFSIDIEKKFNGLREISLCRCSDTGYEFYHPYTLSGGPEFYEALYSAEANRNWSYKESKWEFDVALEAVPEDSARLLDIGSGAGDFLRLAGSRIEHCVGLETSPYGLETSAEKGLNVLNQTIEEHAAEAASFYDVVTAFQVLEHVPDVRSFLSCAIAALKPTGKLIIAVPNNGGFIGKQNDLPLNMPPHHVGLWARGSLEALARIFDLRVLRVEYEPLSEENLGWYIAAMEHLYLPNSRILRSLYYRIGFHSCFSNYVRDNRKSIHGHTILVIFEKTQEAR